MEVVSVRAGKFTAQALRTAEVSPGTPLNPTIDSSYFIGHSIGAWYGSCTSPGQPTTRAEAL